MISSVAVQTHDRNTGICIIINFIFRRLSIFNSYKNNYFFFDIPLNRCRVRRKKCWARTWSNNGCGYTYTHIHHHDSVHDPLIKKRKMICTERSYLSWTCLNPGQPQYKMNDHTSRSVNWVRCDFISELPNRSNVSRSASAPWNVHRFQLLTVTWQGIWLNQWSEWKLRATSALPKWTPRLTAAEMSVKGVNLGDDYSCMSNNCVSPSERLAFKLTCRKT